MSEVSIKRSHTTVLVAIAFSVALISYFVFRYGMAAPKAPTLGTPQVSEVGSSSLPTQEPVKTIPAPPPPPRPIGELAQLPSPEPQLALIGTTTDQLRQFERSLPAGSKIATYAVSGSEQRAAVATNDQNILLVYTTPSTDPDASEQSLYLGMLTREGDHLILRSSTRLYGGLIYTSLQDQQAVPFAIRDVTGDGKPDLVVTSGVGASQGGALQVYSFDGDGLHQIAFARGHFLHLKLGGPGSPSEITAQSRDEDNPKVYRWKGHAFEP